MISNSTSLLSRLPPLDLYTCCEMDGPGRSSPCKDTSSTVDMDIVGEVSVLDEAVFVLGYLADELVAQQYTWRSPGTVYSPVGRTST